MIRDLDDCVTEHSRHAENEYPYTPKLFAVASQHSSPAPALISASKRIAAIAPLAKRMRAAPSPIITAVSRSTSGLWPTQQMF